MEFRVPELKLDGEMMRCHYQAFIQIQPVCIMPCVARVKVQGIATLLACVIDQPIHETTAETTAPVFR